MSAITLAEFKRRHPKLAGIADSVARTIDSKCIQRSAGGDRYPESLLELACSTIATEQRNINAGRVRTAAGPRFHSRGL